MPSINVRSKDISVAVKIGRFIRFWIHYTGFKHYTGLFNYGQRYLRHKGDVKVDTTMKPKTP